MIDKAVMAKIAEDLGLKNQFEMFVNDPLLFLSEPELVKVLARMKYVPVKLGVDEDDLVLPAVINEDDDMDGSPF